MTYSGRYVVIGPPGCGKTTTLARWVARVVDQSRTAFGTTSKHPVMLCSLTRTAASELAGRDMPVDKKMIGTLHSHAYRVLGGPELAEAHAGDWGKDHPEFAMTGVKADMDDLTSEPGEQTRLGDDVYQEYHLLRAKIAPRNGWPEQVRRFANAWERWKGERELLDFTDLIDECINRDLPPANDPEIIIADEAQDLSGLELALLRHWGDAAGALVLGGDPWQCLYAWRGADPSVFLDPSIADDHRHMLHQSYRVPVGTHGVAMQWAKQFDDHDKIIYAPTDVEGRVMHVATSYKEPTGAVRLARRFMNEGKSVIIQASCGFMLSTTLKMLRSAGIPFSNPRRVKRGDWNPLSKRAGGAPQKIKTFLKPSTEAWGSAAEMWTWKQLHAWTSAMRALLILQHGAKVAIETRAQETPDERPDQGTLRQLFLPVAYQFVFDHYIFGQALAADGATEDDLGHPIVDNLAALDWLRGRMLSKPSASAGFPIQVIKEFGPKALEDEPCIHVGTIHSFKGFEADVVILFPDISPSAAIQYGRPGPGRQSVVSAFYVGITRAKETLVLCRPSSSYAVPLHRAAQHAVAQSVSC